jgi:hypothetical protein
MRKFEKMFKNWENMKFWTSLNGAWDMMNKLMDWKLLIAAVKLLTVIDRYWQLPRATDSC